METESPGAAEEAARSLEQLAALASDVHQLADRLDETVSGGEPGSPPASLSQEAQLAAEVSAALRELARHGERFRRAEAAVLYSRGLTMEQVAGVFGVSRQRMSALLHETGNGSRTRHGLSRGARRGPARDGAP